MQVHLTPKLEKLIEERVASGEYESSVQVIEEGLRLLVIREEKLKDLRKAIQEGMASGPSTPLDIEDIIRRGRARLEKTRSTKTR